MQGRPGGRAVPRPRPAGVFIEGDEDALCSATTPLRRQRLLVATTSIARPRRARFLPCSRKPSPRPTGSVERRVVLRSPSRAIARRCPGGLSALRDSGTVAPVPGPPEGLRSAIVNDTNGGSSRRLPWRGSRKIEATVPRARRRASSLEPIGRRHGTRARHRRRSDRPPPHSRRGAGPDRRDALARGPPGPLRREAAAPSRGVPISRVTPEPRRPLDHQADRDATSHGEIQSARPRHENQGFATGISPSRKWGASAAPPGG